MSKRVFIVHGWDGYPDEGWFPWLKKELESKGFAVTVPQFPKPEEPRIAAWVPVLKQAVGKPDEETYFVGHSIGCQTIARYLADLPEGVRVGGAVFVAGFFRRLTNLEDDAVVQSVVTEWLTTPIDLAAVRAHLDKSVAIFSDNDPYVPLDNKDDFVEYLGSTIITSQRKGHFSGSTGATELHSALQAVLDVAE
jgi:predicted alpha/beta hydrolase family esterase